MSLAPVIDFPNSLGPRLSLVERERAVEIDTGAGLAFAVDRLNGDVVSLVFRGVEYQHDAKRSQVGSGLKSARVEYRMVNADIALVVARTDSGHPVMPDLCHYYAARRGDNTLYMATYAGEMPLVGELRWIARLRAEPLPDGPIPSDVRAGAVIESEDVFAFPDGETRSKYYGDECSKARAIDLTRLGLHGPKGSIWLQYDQPRESASGGPFFRDIQHQLAGCHELYNYMYSSHCQTEAFRPGVLHGPYAMAFRDDATPPARLEFGWMEELGLRGWIGRRERGEVRGRVRGGPDGNWVVAFRNPQAQYWGRVEEGRYATPPMKPGAYEAILYREEHEWARALAEVRAGAATELDFAPEEPPEAALLFRIGRRTGTPAGFLNGGPPGIVGMHPADVRLASWRPVRFEVGRSRPEEFPALQLRGINTPTEIGFGCLPSDAGPAVLIIGITCAFKGGRPMVRVNGWAAPLSERSNQPQSRSYTVGTYRGNNHAFAIEIPAGVLVAGGNRITIDVHANGHDHLWLAGGWVYDYIELRRRPGAPPSGGGLTP